MKGPNGCHFECPPLDLGLTQHVSFSFFVVFDRHFRGLLRWAALFLGELRDGLTMINMQSAFLIVSKQYTEKQAGVLFFGEFSL